MTQLLEAKVRVEAIDKDGNTALALAMSVRRQLELYEVDEEAKLAIWDILPQVTQSAHATHAAHARRARRAERGGPAALGD